MNACAVLNTLIEIHGRSLAVYLSDAAPWIGEGGAEARDVVEIVAADHLTTVERLAEVAIERGCEIRERSFPMTYTGLHDLSLSYLLQVLIDEQRQDVARLGVIADQVKNDARLSALVQEAWGAAQGHLESLSEIGAFAS